VGRGVGDGGEEEEGLVIDGGERKNGGSWEGRIRGGKSGDRRLIEGGWGRSR